MCCLSKEEPICIVTDEYRRHLAHLLGTAENSKGPVRLSHCFEKSELSKHLHEPILEASCGCSKHRIPERSIFSQQNFKLPILGYEIMFSGKNMERIRSLITSETGTDHATVRNCFRDVCSLVDNLLIPLLVISKKPFKETALTSSIRASVFYWFFVKLQGTWVKELKYHLAWAFVDGERRAGESRLEYPERDSTILREDGKLAYGLIQKWYDIHLRTKVKKEIKRAFRLSLLQGVKRGMPTVDLNFVKETSHKHAKVLSQKQDTPKEILDFIRKEVPKLIPEYKEKEREGIGSRISHSSCSERSIGQGGALHECIAYEDSCYHDLPEGAFMGPESWHIPLEDNDMRRIIISKILGFDNLSRMFFSEKLGVYEERYRFDLGAVKRTCRRRSLDPDYRPIDTFVKFILEPLKCRTITKAPALVNAIYGDLQQHLWKSLTKRWQFGLTGETVSKEHISNLWAETSYCFPDDHSEEEDYWVSGDYSAATDNMHMDLTEAILDSISRKSESTRHILRRALVNNQINYEGCFEGLEGEDLPAPFTQTNGQLMGCVFSFPLLCIANYLIYKYTIKQVYGTKHLLYKRVPVLVNGDDILFKASTQFIEQWTKNIALVGFSKSVGKNYEAKDFCTINSCYFLPKENKEIPFINNGFIFNKRKGVDSDTILNETSQNSALYTIGFGDYFRQWTGSCLDKYRKAALCILLEHRRDIGWSKRSFFDLGLSDVDDQTVNMRLFSSKVATARAAILIGTTKEAQASNKVITLFNLKGMELPNIKQLYKDCHSKKISLFEQSRKSLLREQKKLLTERHQAGLDPIIGQGHFYRAHPTNVSTKIFKEALNRELKGVGKETIEEFIEYKERYPFFKFFTGISPLHTVPTH